MFILSQILTRAANQLSSKKAILDGPIQFDYGHLLSRVANLAGALLAAGLQRGDRVAILARNSFRYLEVNYACAHAGLILVPVNIRLSRTEMEAICALAGVKFAFVAEPFDLSLENSVRWNDRDAIGSGAYEAFLSSGVPVEAQSCSPSDVAQIFFTSGTTGEPKGACLTHQNLLASALDAIIGLELNDRDVWLHASPMFHLVDAFAIWGVSIVGGLHVVAHFEPGDFAALVAATGITKTSLPPTLLDMIYRQTEPGRHDLSSLDRISYGGSPMQEAVYRRCRELLKCHLLQAYGLTEGGGFVCHQMPSDTEDAVGYENRAGRSTFFAEITVFDDLGQPVGAGEIGEIRLKGTRAANGYWNNRAATEAAFVDGWYRTGDLGRVHADGQIEIVGRKKEMIISGGENVYPAEVINALASHNEVVEVAVFGLPSARWGEEVCAAVFLAEGASAGETDLIAHCRGLIGGYKIPKQIFLSPTPLPKSGPGKVATARIRAWYLDASVPS